MRAKIGTLKQCQYCRALINLCDYEGDGACYKCRMSGQALLQHLIQLSNPRWRFLERELGLKTGGTVPNTVGRSLL